jgi:hypothetical protein
MFPKKLILNLLILFLGVFEIHSAPFTDNSNGTVTDQATGLVWQKCSAGLSGTSCGTGSAGTYTWANALSYCNSLSLASRTWRLPNVNERNRLIISL